MRFCLTCVFPTCRALDAFDQMHQIDPRLPVIIITAHATTENAIEAMKRVRMTTWSSRLTCMKCGRLSARRRS